MGGKKSDFVILFSDLLQFYQQLSFKPIQEYRFLMPYKHVKGKYALKPVIASDDNNLILRCFREREPVSNIFWIEDRGEIAVFNLLSTAHFSLDYSSTLDGLIAYYLEGKTLHLLDVITKKVPPLDVIMDHFSEQIEEIYFYFSPDKFTHLATPEPYVYDGTHLMIHGQLPCAKPFMISPLSRC